MDMFREGTNHGMGWGGGTEVLRSRGASEAVVRAFTHRSFEQSLGYISRRHEPWHGRHSGDVARKRTAGAADSKLF